MPIAMTQEQHALRESIKSLAGEAGTSAVRERETAPAPPARGGKHWQGLADIGLFSLALPEDCGGAGGSITDLAVALEQAADSLIPGPLLPTALAGLILSRHSSVPAARKLLPCLAGGEVSFAVATETGSVTAQRTDNGGLVVSGEITPLLALPEATHILLPVRRDDGDVWLLLEADQPDVHTESRPALDFSLSLGTLTLKDATVSCDAELADLTSAEVADLAVTLAAAEAAGIAAWCLRTAVTHAQTREQFGKPIGGFQAVKHLCAEMLCRGEQASVLAWDAARAADDMPEEHALAAAAAGALALDAAVETAKDCVQVLGGTGFTWEHDAHLYLRRALALRHLSGGSPRWRRRAASLTMHGSRRHLQGVSELPGEAETQRAAIQAVVHDIASLAEDQQRSKLAESGYLMPQWPKPYGHDADLALSVVIDQELERAGVHRPDLAIGGWAVPTILKHGTREQKNRFVLPTLRGELIWCQLFSEPEAGSDLASLRTKAERVEGGWRLTGQKVWTSVAQRAHWAICLARTDPEAPKHKGISYFLVDMASAGIEVRPLREITGEAVFNEVFLDNVFVPDDAIVGQPGEGWKLARTTLANERVAMSGSALGKTVERVLDMATHADAPDRERIGVQVAEALSVSLLGARAALRRLNGDDTGAESSVQKLVGVRHRQEAAELAVDLLGANGAAVDGFGAEPIHEFLLSRCLSIAGGTTQVLRTVAAERILGLPRG